MGQHPLSVAIAAEPLPPASRLTSDCYFQVELLSLQRARMSGAQSGGGFRATATPRGTLTIGGTTAYLVEVEGTDGTSPSDPKALVTTKALRVSGGRGWQARYSTFRANHAAALPTFRKMLGTFHER